MWLAYYHEIVDQHLLDAYRQLLNDEEREQESRFYFARDRLRYLVTRAMVRTVLSRYAKLSPEEWIFSTNEYGRPEIANVNAKDLNISFNISHTHSLIVLGVTCCHALGVDVENVRSREVSIGIADQYFSKREVSDLALVPKSEQQYRFFEYWTLKESYIKARGMGLSLPLDGFGFNFPDARTVEIDIQAELADEPSRWMFWQFQPKPEYLFAVCAERSGIRRPTLLARQVVPMASESILAMDPLRTSQYRE